MGNPVTRASYQAKRLKYIASIVDLSRCHGLEIGACDLPTIPTEVGPCEYADFRSAAEMIEMWSLPADTVVPVNFILSRNEPICDQIDARFDYIIACHVIEHIANPIGYIQDLQKLLDPNGAGIIILAVPDKRETPDVSRMSTSLDHFQRRPQRFRGAVQRVLPFGCRELLELVDGDVRSPDRDRSRI